MSRVYVYGLTILIYALFLDNIVKMNQTNIGINVIISLLIFVLVEVTEDKKEG